MNIVVCDDVEQEAQHTTTFIKNYFKQKNLPLPQITVVQNGIKLLQEAKIDLLFLDIELEEESGIDLANEINNKNPSTIIIFVSNYPFYVTDTYTVEAAQFFIKPLRTEIFEKEFTRILKRYESKQEQFVRKCHGEDIVFYKKDVVYLESSKRIIKVILADHTKQEYYGKISAEEEFFSNSTIIQCHKGFLVNLEYVYGLNHNDLIIQFPDQTQIKIPISRNHYENVKSAYMQYVSLY